jgi:hypothetical protein
VSECQNLLQTQSFEDQNVPAFVHLFQSATCLNMIACKIVLCRIIY